MDFYQKKKQMLGKLDKACKNNLVDEEILPFLNIINKQDEYFTTSSCAGRIVILEIDKIGKKEGSNFIYKQHTGFNRSELKRLLLNYEFTNECWMLVEPPIFHLGACDIKSAKKILDLGLSSGLRRSGIRSISNHWIIVQLWGTGHMDMPLGNKEKNFLSNNPDYVTFILEIAENALQHGKNQLKRFYINLKEEFDRKGQN